MRVTLCVDALEPQPGGIGRYTWELCKGLSAEPSISELQFYARRRLLEDPGHLLRGERVRRGRGPLRLYRNVAAGRALRSTLVHGPNYFIPAGTKTGVITVHDLSVFHFPEMHPAERVQSFERLFSDSLERAAHVITDSRTVARELIEQFALDPTRVTAVPLGVDQQYRPRGNNELAPVLRRWGLQPGEYGLSVAAFEPRKKIAELIGAWRALPQALRAQYPLVLAGNSGWRNEALQREIAAAEAEGWLRMLGFVDEALLPYLYAGASVFIYPSIYEGFGLPPLEAMASGVPAIVSRRSCLPEVCGDAARFIDPDDLPALSGAIVECLLNEDDRCAAVSNGVRHASQYSWQDCIRRTLNVYRRALGAG